MGLIEELANQRCSRLTSRHGCGWPHPEPPERWCDPCKARAELGWSAEAPRFCERCGEKFVRVELSEDREHIRGFDRHGRDRCAEPPLHQIKRFYDEFPKL